ncbi:MAG TPA: RNA-binding protein [Candidatus Saccharimonadales bacterium]|nr:RNA-binding protein [Candidatus Saccharimonadales bacterium]
MSKNLFVGGLAWATTDDTLAAAFSAAGTVESAKVITDRETGRSRGFGFVEMSSDDEAQKAVELLNGKEIDGRSVRVDVAQEKKAA